MAEPLSDDELRDLALAPKVTETAGGKVTERDIADVLKAEDRLTGRSIASGWGGALRPARVVLPGPTGPGERNNNSGA